MGIETEATLSPCNALSKYKGPYRVGPGESEIYDADDLWVMDCGTHEFAQALASRLNEADRMESALRGMVEAWEEDGDGEYLADVARAALPPTESET